MTEPTLAELMAAVRASMDRLGDTVRAMSEAALRAERLAAVLLAAERLEVVSRPGASARSAAPSVVASSPFAQLLCSLLRD